jgi:hypothetical protein
MYADCGTGNDFMTGLCTCDLWGKNCGELGIFSASD